MILFASFRYKESQFLISKGNNSVEVRNSRLGVNCVRLSWVGFDYIGEGEGEGGD